MFCPKCGNAGQKPETYCRNCGVFLPDLEKLEQREDPLALNIKVNSFFSAASALISLGLAILIYSQYNNPGMIPFVLNIVAAFLVVMFVWQTTAFIRTRSLKKQIHELRPPRETDSIQDALAGGLKTAELLPSAELSDTVPASVTDRTTRELHAVSPKSKYEPN